MRTSGGNYSIHPNFEETIRQLPETFHPAQYLSIIQQFGMVLPTKICKGGFITFFARANEALLQETNSHLSELKENMVSSIIRGEVEGYLHIEGNPFDLHNFKTANITRWFFNLDNNPSATFLEKSVPIYKTSTSTNSPPKGR